MATIVPKKQKFFDLNDRSRAVTVGVTVIKLVSTSDTFRVPTLAKASEHGSVKQLERFSDPTVTTQALDVDVDGFYRTVQLDGTAGNEVVIVTLHEGRFNFNDDEDAV